MPRSNSFVTVVQRWSTGWKVSGRVSVSSVPPYKTSYPTDKHYLYFSGNEKAFPYVDHSDPAPRGHRVLAKGLGSGKALWNTLHQAVLTRKVTFVPLATVEDLLLESGRVVGVRFRALDAATAGSRHRRLSSAGGKLGNWFPALGSRFTRRADALWQQSAKVYEVRANGVVLSGGGFIYNREMVAANAPDFVDVAPLGTPADDGSSILLGTRAGGITAHLDKVTVWRFLSPPSALIEGVTVGGDGRRIANEDLYGATHGNVMMREFSGQGWVIYDSRQWRKARGQLISQTQIFQRLQGAYLFTFGHSKASTLHRLAQRIGVPVLPLTDTIAAYNAGIAGSGDPAGKRAEFSSPVECAPFYAVNISAKNTPFYPVPGLTLGGLRVDESSGEVINSVEHPIPGLYAAGRTAVGVCSNSYVSGLSLADCLFSGRRAGRHAALYAAR